MTPPVNHTIPYGTLYQYRSQARSMILSKGDMLLRGKKLPGVTNPAMFNQACIPAFNKLEKLINIATKGIGFSELEPTTLLNLAPVKAELKNLRATLEMTPADQRTAEEILQMIGIESMMGYLGISTPQRMAR